MAQKSVTNETKEAKIIDSISQNILKQDHAASKNVPEREQMQILWHRAPLSAVLCIL